MAEKDKITETKVKWSGLFDFKETYQFMHRWLSDQDYWIEEKKYLEEISGDAKKIEIKWTASKKISDYFKFEIKLDWRIIGMTSVEVDQGGKKVKMNKGSFECKFSSTLIKDWAGAWDATPMQKFMRGIYERFIIEGRIRSYEDKLYGEMDEAAEQLKAFLTIEGKK